MKKLIVAAAAALAVVTSAGAEDFPSKPITIIVPFAAGGPTDALARAVSERIRQALGQTVVIENVTGAAGTIGVNPRRALGARWLHHQHGTPAAPT